MPKSGRVLPLVSTGLGSMGFYSSANNFVVNENPKRKLKLLSSTITKPVADKVVLHLF